ncbi:MAG TPA: TIR domain-containing protein [Chthonomonadaceae bacterium]|nr:TIR domain-containing protein [Chthonomonadaceae bacterium]
MPVDFDYDVFLIYSTKDEATVQELAERLRSDGLRVWFENMRPGDSKIKKRLEHSRTLVLVMSANVSDEEWTDWERIATLFRDPTDKQRRFLPLLLQDCHIPETLRRYDYIDWRNQENAAYLELREACRPASPSEMQSATSELPPPVTLDWRQGGHVGAIRSLALHPNGQWIVSGSADNTLKLWDLGSGQCLRTFEGHTGAVFSVSVLPDGERMVSGSADNTFKLWDLGSGQCLRTFEGHTRTVFSVCVHSDGERLVSGSQDKTLKLWDIGSGQCLRTFEGHTAEVLSVSVHPDGERLVSGSADNTLKLWDIGSGLCLWTFEGHTGTAWSVCVHPDGQWIVSGSSDDMLKLWDIGSGLCLRTFEGHTSAVFSVCVHPDGQWIVSGSWDKTLKLWDLASGECLRTFEGHAGEVNSLAIHPDGQWIVSGSADKTLKLWDIGSGLCLRTFEGHTTFVNSVSMHPDGQWIVSGSADNTLKLWDIGSGLCLRTFEGHTTFVNSLAIHPDRERMVSGSADKTLKLWDLRSGQCLSTIEGHTTFVNSLAIHPDGQWIVSGSADNTLKLWDLETLACLQTLEAANDFQGVAFSGDGSRMVAGNDDGSVYVYSIADTLTASLTPMASNVLYTSVKVVLVGESNVGKSYLAHRIATGAPPEEGTIKSTHGMQFWPLEPQQLSANATTPAGQRRDVVLWDMGGQEEYRLIHQLFLHDTTLALVLLDPTRGATAFKEVETWNKYLDKQLHGRAAVKLLVGAKLDQPSDTIDRQGLERLCKECGFAGYYETSALNGRGIPELCEAAAKAIDWDRLGLTSRPELFQRIRDEIEARRRRGEVILHDADLHRALSDQPPTREEERSVNAVAEQLATQGVIARSRVSTGEPVLVLQVQEIERYAGSLIIAARENPRGVPALELTAISQPDFPLPGIPTKERLPRSQERPVLECTVQLMLEHGICFLHEGLLVFPTLFAPVPTTEDTALPHAVSLYYDFAGAIDNIYASLIAWLVLARDFGQIRLWSDRAEFALQDGSLCGLRKVGRPGGFAHVDVYFDANTPSDRKELFISFVEEHVRRHGVEIREHVAILCPCGEKIDEEVIRKRIARGDKDVRCPVCETRHELAEGAAAARERNPQIEQQTWALKTEIEKRRQETTEQAVKVIEKAAEIKRAEGPIRLLHLSDLHFTANIQVSARLQWLLDDLKQKSGLGIKKLDYLVISGDFTDRGGTAGFERAYEFVSGLTGEFGLSAERCIFVPGNHDVMDIREAYDWRDKADGLKEGEWVRQGDIILARNAEKYPLRFKPFSDGFYHKFLQRPYPTEYAEQGISLPFWETGIQFLTLNSCWQIDQFYRKRSGLHPEAVANAIKQAQKQEELARQIGYLKPEQPVMRIAVWHHAVTGAEQIQNGDFLSNLQKNGVKIALHGDVHEMRRDLVRYWDQAQKLNIVGSGSFGARAEDRPPSTPCLYNLLEIARDLKSIRVHTREQRKPDGAWSGWHEWPAPKGIEGQVAYYDIGW